MVPEDSYTSLIHKQHQLLPPVTTQMSNLDQELKYILDNPSLNVDEKYNRYYSTFSRYGKLHAMVFPKTVEHPVPPMVGQIPAPPPAQVPPDIVQQQQQPLPVAPPLPVVEERLIAGLPKTCRRKGRMLLDHIKKKPGFQWTDNGGLHVDGGVVPGSNIIDLVHYFTRKRPKALPPPGSEELAVLLKDTNVPMEAVDGESFRRVGTSDWNLGTLFSPVPQPPPVEQFKTPEGSPTERKKSPRVVKQSPLRNRLRRQMNDNIDPAVVKLRDFY